jgi:hypothetical protein
LGISSDIGSCFGVSIDAAAADEGHGDGQERQQVQAEDPEGEHGAICTPLGADTIVSGTPVVVLLHRLTTVLMLASGRTLRSTSSSARMAVSTVNSPLGDLRLDARATGGSSGPMAPRRRL